MIVRGITLSDLIGYRFEYFIHTKYPFLTWNQRRSNLPDFSCDDFHLEVKGQCKVYGGRIQPDQVEKFRLLDKPVFYMYGWHSQIGLSKMRKSTMVRTVARMDFRDLCLIDNFLIERFFDKEQRYSKKQKVNGDNHYCVLKPRHIRDIITNAEVERKGKLVRTHTFYRLNVAELDFTKVNEIQLLTRKALKPLVTRLVC